MLAVRDAATVMLLADRPDLHLFVLRRTPAAVFGPGATVFPGGAVDDGDRDDASVVRIMGLDGLTAETRLGRAGALAWWIAAARECFEEAGILLARDATTGDAPQVDDPTVTARLDAWRARLNAGTVTFGEMLAAEHLVIDARDLEVFSHWRTPIGPPRRYDTWFFVAAAPEGQEGIHDDNELVESAWMRPLEAITRFEAGELDLVFPTFVTLATLARFDRAADALAAIAAAPRHEDGRPYIVQDRASERIALPGERPDAVGWCDALPDLSWRTEAEHHGDYASLRAAEGRASLRAAEGRG